MTARVGRVGDGEAGCAGPIGLAQGSLADRRYLELVISYASWDFALHREAKHREANWEWTGER